MNKEFFFKPITFSLKPITGGKDGSIYENGACIHEICQTDRQSNGEWVIQWFCYLSGEVCDFNPEIGNCQQKKFTSYKKP